MGQVLNLHVLRALTTVIVVVCHAVMQVHRWAGFSDATLIAVELLGRMAVDTFFVISGFIMIYTSTALFGRAMGAVEFARRRVVRIVPLYWLATAAETAARSINHRVPSVSELAHSLLFLPQVVQPGQPLRPVVGVGWTLNYEAFFYGLFGLTLLLRRDLGVAALLTALVAIVGWGATEKPLTDTSLPTTVGAFITDRIILMFGAGVAIGFICDRRDGSFPERIRHPLLITVVTTAMAVVVVLASGQGAYPSLGLDIVLRANVIAAFVIFVFGRTFQPGRPTGFAVVIGDASYSIYLFHFLLIISTEKIWFILCGTHAAPVCAILISMVTIAGGVVLYGIVERPMTRRLGRLTATRLNRRRAAVPKDDRPLDAALTASIQNSRVACK